MADRLGSPRLNLHRCDEDIDLLSEMLGKSSDVSSEGEIDLTQHIHEGEMDELSSYLCGNSSPLNAEMSQCPAQLDPFMSPSAPESPLFMTPGNKERSCSPSSIAHSPQREQNKVTTSSERLEPKSVVVYVPKSQPCPNKNAMAARENRKKKKEYVEQLETNVKTLRYENSELKTKLSDQEETIENLKEQVKYLQNVIANQSTLSALLKNIETTSGVQLKSSWATRRKLTEVGQGTAPVNKSGEIDENQENENTRLRQRKRKCELQSDTRLHGKRVNIDKTGVNPSSDDLCGDDQETKPDQPAGVCLHVSGTEVSLEFCVKCSKMAASNRVLNDHSYVRSNVDL